MIKPSFISLANIHQLRDLIRYRTKNQNYLSDEKNWALNRLTVFNLKLGVIFSDVFDKSARSIAKYIFVHPGKHFDFTPFVDKRCKQLIEEYRLPLLLLQKSA